MPKVSEKLNLIDKRGDRGTTSLFSGERVSKSSLRTSALGDLDELQSILGLARYFAKKPRIKKEILELQQDLFIAGSEIATSDAQKDLLAQRVDKVWLGRFERKVQALHDVTQIPKNFVIPGDILPCAYLHLARAVARRCERNVVKLAEEKIIENENLLAWMNRLSIYIFLMAQFEGTKQRIKKK